MRSRSSRGHTPTAPQPPLAAGSPSAPRPPCLALGAGAARRAGRRRPRRSGADQPRHRQRLPRAHRGSPRDRRGGIAALATAVNQMRATNPNTVFAAAGDMIGASTFTSFIQEDVPTIETLNAAGLDVSAAGNHEFDQGWADLTRPRACRSPTGSTSRANVYDKATGRARARAEYWIEEVRAASRSASSAPSPRSCPSLVSPAGIADIDVEPVVDSVNAVADQLTDGDAANGEADVVVLLVHEGAATTDVASATDLEHAVRQDRRRTSTDDVDAIVSGHTHLAYNHGRSTDAPGHLVGQYGEQFSDMEIEVDPRPRRSSRWRTPSYTMTTGRRDRPAVTCPVSPAGCQPIVPIVAEAVADGEGVGSVELGDITASFQRGCSRARPRRRPVDPRTAAASRRSATSSPTCSCGRPRRGSPRTQIAFMNPGGLRADMLGVVRRSRRQRHLRRGGRRSSRSRTRS